MKKITLIFLFVSFFNLSTFPQSLPEIKIEQANMSAEHLMTVDKIIDNAIDNQQIPGAVLLITRYGKTIYRNAYGNSQLIPEIKPMQPELLFDLASITKPIATATSIMKLVEMGKIRLWDRVKQFIPEFTTYRDESGKSGSDVRLWHLLTHTSGLPPYTDAKKIEQQFGSPCPLDSIAVHIARLAKTSDAGAEFHYSCLGFITLANIVKRVSGETIDVFSQKHIFEPLKMKHTFFNPAPQFHGLCVPTEVIDGQPLIGVVHDPLARLQGGISGNAGLFSTADDIAIFAQMLLNHGSYDRIRILSPLTVKRMTSLYPEVAFAGRGLGWDLNSAYSTNGGDLFGPNSFGHTGYTGTSLWIDPDTQTTVIFLTNRVHPDDGGSVVALRSKVANVVASSIIK